MGRLIRPRMKGFVSLEAHPEGCARLVATDAASAAVDGQRGDQRPVLVLGASSGYGLASAIVAAFRYRSPVIAVALERPAERDRTASAGWYNLCALASLAAEEGIAVDVINADCFSDATKERVVTLARERHGKLGALIYSVAAPQRVDAVTGARYRSVLKPVGEKSVTKSLRLDTREVLEVELSPATDEEIEGTRRVMGGEDWAAWNAALRKGDVTARGFRTVAYTYVGPEVTHAIYRSGTIGLAKADLESTARTLDAGMTADGGGAWASVNGAVVTQAASAIPAVPLYISLLYRAVQDLGVARPSALDHARWLFDDHLFADGSPEVDAEGRIRLDGWELEPDLQAEIARRWAAVETETLGELGDFDQFYRDFRRLSGFDVDGVDYDEPVEVDWALPTTPGNLGA